MAAAGRLAGLLTICVALIVEGAVPDDLSNFQNEFVCDTDVRLVRPRSVSDVEEAVRRHARVKAVGAGHSYNKFTCSLAPEDANGEGTSANIVMTTIRPLVIDVDECEMSAWVSAGVAIWDLMEYLGNYVTPSAPRGYALGSTPAYVNQTIAGSIATNTHASSLVHGSLSNQVIGFRVVLANGTTTEIYPYNHPLYFRAFQVNVGRLGVVTEVKMRIIKETLVRRTFFIGIPKEDVMSRISYAQELYKSTGRLPASLFGSMYAYNPTDSTFLMYTFEDQEPELSDSENSDCDYDVDDLSEESQEFLEDLLMDTINAPFNRTRAENGQDIADGVSWEEPEPLPANPIFLDPNNTASFVAANVESFLTFLGNDTLDTHRASVNWPIPDVMNIELTLADDYEVSMPVDKMADCLEGAIALIDSQTPDNGLRGWVPIRFVGKETGLLSISNDKPRMWFEFADFVYYSQGRQSNIPHKRLLAYFVTSPLCSPARLHWGKGGWPDPGCWNGAEIFKDTWCDFGCAVNALDPEDKFTGDVPEMWNWEGANLDMCCTEDGYDKSKIGCDCTVVRQRHPDECPPAPFYTNR